MINFQDFKGLQLDPKGLSCKPAACPAKVTCKQTRELGGQTFKVCKAGMMANGWQIGDPKGLFCVLMLWWMRVTCEQTRFSVQETFGLEGAGMMAKGWQIGDPKGLFCVLMFWWVRVACEQTRFSAQETFGLEGAGMMANGLPIERIGNVTMPIERQEVPLAGTIYRQIGVRLWGVGAYERESIDGSQTKYATLSRVESGDIIVNKIWARNGSVAVVSDELAGCFGSGEFPTFAPDREKLEPKWFHWITKTSYYSAIDTGIFGEFCITHPHIGLFSGKNRQNNQPYCS